MGRYDKEYAALIGSANTDLSPQKNRYASEYEALFAPPIEPEPVSQYQQDKQAVTARYGAVPSVDVTRSPRLQEIQQAQPIQGPPIPKQSEVRAEMPSRKLPVIGPIFKAVDKVVEKPGADKTADFFRSIYTPGASVANVAGLVGAAGNIVARAAPGIGETLAGKVAQTAAQEAIVGAPLAAGQALTQTGDLEEAAKQGAIGAAVGGVLGAAAPLAGQLAKYTGTKIGDTLGKLYARHDAVTPEMEKRVNSLLNSAGEPAKPANVSSILKPATQEQYINKVMSEIKTEVTQRMTPPLENPKELAKFVQQHWDDPISLNEVRKLPYDDLAELAQEMASKMKVAEIAKQVARERGYNLEKILDGEIPSVTRRATEDAQKRVYGVYPEELPPVSRRATAAEAQTVETQPLKQSWMQRLFGDQGQGISAFGKKDGRTGTGIQIVDKPIKSTLNGLWERTKSGGRSAYQNHIDMNDPLKNISKETYETAMDAQRASQVANTIVRDKFVDAQGNVIGKGLRELIRQHGRGKYNELTDYLVARHAVTRMRRGEQVYADKLAMTVDKIEARVKEIETRNPEFATIGKDWNNYYKNIRDEYGVKEGLITPELAQYLERENPNYASMMRQFTDREKFAKPLRMGSKPAFSGQKAPIKEVSPTGSARKIVDPVRSAIEATDSWVKSAFRNRVMQKVVDSVTADPQAMKKIAEIVQPPKGQRDLVDILKKDGEEAFLQAMQEDFDGLFKRTRLDQDNIVRAMVKGKPVYVKVHDPEAVKALLGMGAEQSNLVLDVFRFLSNATKYGATGALAPMFAVKGALMDLPQAIIQSKNPLVHMMDLGHALISSIANELKIPGLRNLARDFERSGGGYSAALRGERQLSRGVSGMKNRPILSAPNLAITAGKAIASPFKVLNSVADVTENLHRVAAFRSELRRLGDIRSPENIRKAMEASREITVNYSRRGRQSRSIEAVIPYNNAAIQSLYRFARQWKKQPVKTAALVTTTILAPKFYEYMQFHDDPDYNNLPARERYRNLFISKNGDGTFNKIPMAPEYNALGAFFVDMLRSYKDGNPEAFKGASDAVVNAYTPPIVSGMAQGVTQGGGINQSLAGTFNATVAGPGVNVVANQSFTGAPIVSRAVEGRSQQYQYDEKTSAVAKKLGQWTDFSPMKIDYILRSYGGDPARLVLPLTSPVGGGTTRNTMLKNFITDPVFTNNLTTDYYDAKDKLQQAYADHQDLDIPFPEWYDDNLRKEVTSTAKGSVTKRLSELTDQKKQLSADKSLGKEQRAQRIRDVQQQINQIYIDINSKLRDNGVPMADR